MGGYDLVDIATYPHYDIDTGLSKEIEELLTYRSANDGVDCQIAELAGACNQGNVIRGDMNGVRLFAFLKQEQGHTGVEHRRNPPFEYRYGDLSACHWEGCLTWGRCWGGRHQSMRGMGGYPDIFFRQPGFCHCAAPFAVEIESAFLLYSNNHAEGRKCSRVGFLSIGNSAVFSMKNAGEQFGCDGF